MIRRIIFSILLLVGIVFIQTTWFDPITILGVAPDLALVVLIWLSYKNGMVAGPITGFVAGFAEDALSVSPPGFNAFLRTGVSWCASLLHGSFAIDRLLLPFLLGAGGTILKMLLSLALGLLFGDRVRTFNLFSRDAWLEVAYNAVISPVVFFVLHSLRRFFVAEDARG